MQLELFYYNLVLFNFAYVDDRIFYSIGVYKEDELTDGILELLRVEPLNYVMQRNQITTLIGEGMSLEVFSLFDALPAFVESNIGRLVPTRTHVGSTMIVVQNSHLSGGAASIRSVIDLLKIEGKITI
jgi:hypothetical protein